MKRNAAVGLLRNRPLDSAVFCGYCLLSDGELQFEQMVVKRVRTLFQPNDDMD